METHPHKRAHTHTHAHQTPKYCCTRKDGSSDTSTLDDVVHGKGFSD